jgi:hypothetical protein
MARNRTIGSRTDANAGSPYLGCGSWRFSVENRGEYVMTKKPDADAGTLQAILERLEKFRLPRAQAIKARVDKGESLSDNDIQFLKQALDDAQSVQGVVARHPEVQALAKQIVGLYDEITRKALENEKGK